MKTSRVPWVMSAILAVVVLGGVGMLFVRLRPYWIAKYRGAGAHLRGAVLTFAPLAGVDLSGADLRGADLRGADLQRVELLDADLRGADLRGVNLQGTALEHLTDMVSVTIEDGPPGKPGRGSVTHGDDPELTGARYDAATRWPAGFDPRRHGACRVK